MVDVRLVDLEVIKRYSLAVRRDTVPAAELLEALDASRALVVAAISADGAVPTGPDAREDTAEDVAAPRPGGEGS